MIEKHRVDKKAKYQEGSQGGLVGPKKVADGDGSVSVESIHCGCPRHLMRHEDWEFARCIGYRTY